MTLSWPKYLMLWLAIAAYTAQAVVGGSGWAICFGEGHQAAKSTAQKAPIAPTCEHAGACEGAEPKIVQQHPSEDHCPCTDISIDDSEPGRIEDQTKLLVAKIKVVQVIATDWMLPLASTSLLQANPPRPLPRGPVSADVVRTTVLLI